MNLSFWLRGAFGEPASSCWMQGSATLLPPNWGLGAAPCMPRWLQAAPAWLLLLGWAELGAARWLSGSSGRGGPGQCRERREHKRATSCGSLLLTGDIVGSSSAFVVGPLSYVLLSVHAEPLHYRHSYSTVYCNANTKVASTSPVAPPLPPRPPSPPPLSVTGTCYQLPFATAKTHSHRNFILI